MTTPRRPTLRPSTLASRARDAASALVDEWAARLTWPSAQLSTLESIDLEKRIARAIEAAVRRELARARRPRYCACHNMKPCPLGASVGGRGTTKRRAGGGAKAKGARRG